MKTYLISLDANGNIRSSINVPKEDLSLQQAPDGHTLMEVTIDSSERESLVSNNYVVDGQIVPKLPMGLAINKTTFTANGNDVVAITEIPSGATVTITGAVTFGPETVTDGYLTITSTKLGTINVAITLRPTYFDWVVVLNAD